VPSAMGTGMWHMRRPNQLICSVALLGLAATAIPQATGTGTASVNCVVAIAVTETATTDWGKVARPSNGTTDYTLDWDTGAVTLSGSTSTGYTGYTYDTGHKGAWAVTGDPDATYSFSAAIGTFSGTGVTVQAAHINGTSDTGSGTLSGTGTATLNTGGIIRVSAAAGTGSHSATVTISVDYT
jgi:hypothetical protein